MKFVGKTKVGKAKTNPKTVLAIVRLPVELKDYAGKWAHIWRMDESTIAIRFSDSREVDEIPSVYYVGKDDIEKRLEILEKQVEQLAKLAEHERSEYSGSKAEISHGRDLNP
ncbi:MAG TPA: hypothetical protein EYP60_01920 [bacterium (Candidatus Stahlbacteria)]|nr:hypothetical protein [Candidatus Stahlbacteria bacterium]